MSNDLPLIRELTPAPDVEACLARYRHLPFCLLLDSARRDPKLGRYSYLMAAPVRTIRKAGDELDIASDPSRKQNAATARGAGIFDAASDWLIRYATPAVAELPPFQGGVAGFLSYDLAHGCERLARPRYDEFQLPVLVLGLYDVVLAWDHLTNRAWLISQGIAPRADHAKLSEPDKKSWAQSRLDAFASLLSCAAENVPDRVAEIIDRSQGAGDSNPSSNDEKAADVRTARLLSADELAPNYAMANVPGLRSNFTAEQYIAAIERVREYIRAGDAFQINLSQRLLLPAQDESWQLYRRLRNRNAATFAGYFDFGDAQIISASPERFLRVQDRVVEARPIKGTRPRIFRPEADLFTGDDLQASDKDRAENVMIADLLRNDLSRVCRPDSVRVTELCRLEMYEYVHHLVSVIQGRLQDDRTRLDLIRAAWPGGSITGAPKIRAMEIITELEQVARGAYCGLLIYLGLDGSMDSNLLIRTITASRGWWQFPVGGGITLASDPELEYAETWHKARGLLQSLGI